MALLFLLTYQKNMIVCIECVLSVYSIHTEYTKGDLKDMPTEYTFDSLKKESTIMKKYIFMTKFGRRWNVARRFTRKEIQEYHKLMTGEDIVRSFIMCLNTFETGNEECEWQFKELKAELLHRLSY